MATREGKFSLVELFEHHGDASRSGTHCGYCQGKSSISDGIWGYRLTVTDYQNLLQRGWRRSGKYVYKPVMKRTCCPQYAIRCEALKFQLTRSQKKVLRRMYNYLAVGRGEERIRRSPGPLDAETGLKRPSQSSEEDMDTEEEEADAGGEQLPRVTEPPSDTHPENMLVPDYAPADIHTASPPETTAPAGVGAPAIAPAVRISSPLVVKGRGPDPNRPPQRKAKELRRERKAQKLLKRGVDAAGSSTAAPTPSGGTLEAYFDKPLPEQSKHRLEFRLVSTSDNDRDADFTRTFDEVFRVYAKYELTVHKKDAEHPTPKQFSRFLAESPLQRQLAPQQADAEAGVYGSFHLQYIMDGKIIGVDVVDILPDCVTSVYFFYDPDYRYLSLGTYSVLREVYLVRQLHARFPGLQYASLGFYVHSCAKMQYKAGFQPSHLLCPETYTWHPLAACLPRLSLANYQRLAAPAAQDEEGRVWEYVSQTLVLFQRNLMPFDVYRMSLQRLLRPAGVVLRKEVERVTHYALLVGRQCAPSMALYCDNAPIHQSGSA